MERNSAEIVITITEKNEKIKVIATDNLNTCEEIKAELEEYKDKARKFTVYHIEGKGSVSRTDIDNITKEFLENNKQWDAMCCEYLECEETVAEMWRKPYKWS